MTPTTDFRWLRRHAGDIGWKHPSALRLGEAFVLVLQQRWAAEMSNETEEWRDIPMMEVDSPRYTITEAGRKALEGRANEDR